MNKPQLKYPVFLGISSHTSVKMELLRDAGYRGEVTILENADLINSARFFKVEGIDYRASNLSTYQMTGQEGFYLGSTKPPEKITLYAESCSQLMVDWDSFPTLIHPSSSIASTVSIGNGSHIEQGVIIASYATIELGVNIKRGCSVGHHTVVGECSTLNPGVTIAGNCRIGKGVTVGVGAIIFDNVKIGEGSIIGGGSLVTKDVPAGVIAFGNPCKVVKSI